MKFAINAMLVLLVLCLMAASFRVGMYVQVYYTLKQEGEQPYATFEQTSANGLLLSRCNVYEVQR